MAPPTLPSSYLFSVLESQMAAVSATGMLIQSAYAAALGGGGAIAANSEAPSEKALEISSGRIRIRLSSRGEALTCHVECPMADDGRPRSASVSAQSLDDLEMQLHRLDLSRLMASDETRKESPATGLLKRARRKFEEAHLRADFETALEALFASLECKAPI